MESALEETNNQRRIIANTHCFYGELAEMKEEWAKKKSKKSDEAKRFAANQYFKAISIYPFIGRYYILLGNLTKKHHDNL
jgi:ribonuclease ZC3H12